MGCSYQPVPMLAMNQMMMTTIAQDLTLETTKLAINLLSTFHSTVPEKKYKEIIKNLL